MVTKSDLATPTLMDGWLRDLALTPIERPDPATNWNLEFKVAGPSPLTLRVVSPKPSPRAIMLICMLSSAPEQVAAFNKLGESSRKEFWQRLRSTLNRESVEFQIEGAPFVECPSLIHITAVRYDDGLSLDSFARTVASVIKASYDVVFFYHAYLGETGAAPGGEFAFKKLEVQ